MSQGESAVTEPQVTAAAEARAERAPEEAVAVEAEAGPAVGDGAMADAVPGEDADPDAGPADDAEAPDGDAEPAPPDLASLEFEGEIAADYIEGLLDVADLDGDIDMDVEGDRALVSVVGATLEELVGPRGEVLEALQELTRLAVHRQTGSRTRIMIDVGGYRMRRRSELAETGVKNAEGVSAKVAQAFVEHSNWRQSEAELRELRKAVTFAVYAEVDDLDEVTRIVDRLFSLLAKAT